MHYANLKQQSVQTHRNTAMDKYILQTEQCWVGVMLVMIYFPTGERELDCTKKL